MKERPILFSGEMVRAILDGRKTQTRRMINPQIEINDDKVYQRRASGTLDEYFFGEFLKRNPYGNIGDRLWVRETFVLERWEDEPDKLPTDRPVHHYQPADLTNEYDNEYWNIPHYRATDPAPDLYYGDIDERDDGEPKCKWRPSIFMPRWASRILLEIVDVRFERLQEITRDNAKAEGVSNIWSWTPDRKHDYHRRGLLNPYVANYSVLWDEIHEKSLIGNGWNANPWVWVIEFKRLETVHANA